MSIYHKFIVNISPYSLIGAFFLGAIASALILHSNSRDNNRDFYESNSIQNCLEIYKDAIIDENNKISLSRLQNRLDQCIKQVNAQVNLNEFNIRRQGFAQQRYDENVLLWMVVGITASGVLLSGLQLVGAYNLAKQGAILDFSKDSEIVLEQNKISLKSSITGLLIPMGVPPAMPGRQ